jgi:hypothetical protein
MSKIFWGCNLFLGEPDLKNASLLKIAEFLFLASEARVTRYVFLIEKINESGGDASRAEGMLKIFQDTARLRGLLLIKEQERLQQA